VTGPWIAIKRGKAFTYSRANGIQVNIADDFFTIILVLRGDGTIAIAEEISLAIVSFIVMPAVCGIQPPHEGGGRLFAGAQKKMIMIRH